MTMQNIAESEKMYGQFVAVKDYEGLWRVGANGDQSVVQLDADIHLENEKKVGKKAQSDPICSSAGCT